ncbi:hypothetical protein EYS09_03850 [Streptomyces kasugaensis]|uniref:Uncharacterized protein n=1 Tax=Streptomyces kasugaensis TaxID=1946 RepID=A0A4Q9I038_STRKA|nr:hypothetical protein EYS09_03850 [Streptomyces kasugaensis]
MTAPADALLPPDADSLLGPVLSGLTACLCAVLAEGGRPTCACCLVWGNSPPAQDFCSCDCEGGHGQAWVRVVRQEPVVVADQRRRRCQMWRMETVIEVGVARCVAVVAPDGQSAPTCEQREADAWGLVLDQRLLREAVACCVALDGVQVRPGPVTPMGPQGGCAGVTMQITVEV